MFSLLGLHDHQQRVGQQRQGALPIPGVPAAHRIRISTTRARGGCKALQFASGYFPYP
ncbi:MAG: hypothetical protein M3441_23885 [Chloroflexota bacterium]|nr:hypothetical protein [Chloroflexota bacterium]